jgi:hypothetical protein
LEDLKLRTAGGLLLLSPDFFLIEEIHLTLSQRSETFAV